MELREGELFAGNYRILALLGHGGSGRVYLARQESIGMLRAIKAIGRDSLQSAYVEMSHLRSLHHPGLPQILDMIESPEASYLVMEYIPGVSLQTYLKEQGQSLLAEQIIDAGLQICQILAYLHRQKPSLIYRDLKPENVMRRPDGRFVLVDLGTAVTLEGSFEQECALGSPSYAAPEQYEGRFDARSDIYALGRCLYRMTEQLSPPKSRLERRRRRLLARVIRRACQERARDRYSQAEAMEKALGRILSSDQRERREDKGGALPRLVRGFFFLFLIALILGLLLLWRGSVSKEAGRQEAKRILESLEGQLEAYKEDLRLDLQEEEVLLRQLTSQRESELMAQLPEAYAAFCSQMGRLYCYYTDRRDQAERWFDQAQKSLESVHEMQEASREEDRIQRDGMVEERVKDKAGQRSEGIQELREEVALYQWILHFARDLSQRRLEGRERGFYLQHFQRLKEYKDSLNQAESVRVQLIGQVEIVESLYRYQKDYREDGVGRGEYRALLEEIKSRWRKLSLRDQSLREKKEKGEELIAHIETVMERGGES